MPLTSHDLLQRVCQYIGAMDLPGPASDDCLKKATRFLESPDSPPEPRAKLHAVLKFLRSFMTTTSFFKDNSRPISRSTMTYREFSQDEHDDEHRQRTHDGKEQPIAWEWKRHARVRRAVLLLSLLAAMSFGVMASSAIFSGTGIPGFKIPMIAVFSFLFAWVALNCITTIFGFILFCQGHDPLNPSNVLKDEKVALPEGTPIAVLLPIYNEDVTQIFAGLQVMYESLEATGRAAHFTFFILSDTQQPDVWINEEVAWRKFCEEHKTHGRVVYRHRKSRVGRKSGNVADFCRRWGKQFTYMIVLDSDSLLDGKTMVQMATIMSARPDIGILQTTPQNFNGKTLLARLLQFTSQAYGPIFIMGLHYWQLGDSAYWGHNAILRVEPFMKYCVLPKPRGRLPLGGMILSHDSIEAALMRRAGWGVWLAYDLAGSFEQPPSTLTTELTRDARWCRGNIQHLRYLGLKGLTLGHRWLFLNGNFFYGASFLWMLLLLLVTANSAAKMFLTPNYFPNDMSLFPEWPNQHREMAFILLAVTFIYLFLPKCLAVIATAVDSKTRRSFGGLFPLILSSVVEILCSSLLAPLRMVLHCYHVMTSLSGRRFDWHTSSRSATGINFWDAFKIGAIPTVMGLVAAFSLYHIDRTLFWWTSVVSIPLFFSIPLAMLISRGDTGDFFKMLGLLRAPTETTPSAEIARYDAVLALASHPTPSALAKRGFAGAVLDPNVQSLHRQILRTDRRLHASVRSRRQAIAAEALKQGPKRLSAGHKREILYDPQLLAQLHEQVWALPEVDFIRWSR